MSFSPVTSIQRVKPSEIVSPEETPSQTFERLISEFQLTTGVHIKLLTFNKVQVPYVTPDGWAHVARSHCASIKFGQLYQETVGPVTALCVECKVKTGPKGKRRKVSMVGSVVIHSGIALDEAIKKVHTNAMARAIRFALGLSVNTDDIDESSVDKEESSSQK